MNPPRFNHGEAIMRAQAALTAPAPLDRIVRVKPLGRRVAVFALPLELCQPQNRTRHGEAWRHARDKHRVAMFLGMQHAKRREPLPGRPMIRCVRFSSSEPDAYNDGFKMAVDVLCKPTLRSPNRLNFVVDDRPKDAIVVMWWEPAPPRKGLGYIEVWTGEETVRRTA